MAIAQITSSEGGSTKTILMVLGVAVAGYLAYTYIIKPKMDKSKEEKK